MIPYSYRLLILFVISLCASNFVCASANLMQQKLQSVSVRPQFQVEPEGLSNPITGLFIPMTVYRGRRITLIPSTIEDFPQHAGKTIVRYSKKKATLTVVPAEEKLKVGDIMIEGGFLRRLGMISIQSWQLLLMKNGHYGQAARFENIQASHVPIWQRLADIQGSDEAFFELLTR